MTLSRSTHAAPWIDVYTMGPGEELFSRFGHAAICVTDVQSPLGRCYNYGTADFSTPGPLTWGILRGHGLFWVSVLPLPRMLAIYRHEDRTLYRQRLPLDEATAGKVAELLHAADVKSATLYNYHHINDNCTTRIRDLLDNVLGHALYARSRVPDGPPLRGYLEDGLRGEPGLLALSELVLGRVIDRPSSRWQGMFLPTIFRAELGEKLGAKVEVLYERQAPLPTSSRRAGTWLLALLGLGLAGLVLCGARLPGPWPYLGRLPAALALGTVGLLVFALVVCSPLAELRYNEVLFICWPTDLYLAFPESKRYPRAIHRYATARLLFLLGCGLGAAASVLKQPLLGPLLLCALPLYAVRATSRFS